MSEIEPYDKMAALQDQAHNLLRENAALRAEVEAFAHFFPGEDASQVSNEVAGLRARIAKLEAELVKTREELIEQVLSTDIWLSFDGKEWVMVSAVRQALHGEVEK